MLFSCSLVGCSKDIDSLPLNEQSIHLASRFSNDISKDRYRKPLEILNFSEVSPGKTVVDLLGGGGYYSELFSHIVGKQGQIFLQNNSLFLRFSKKELEERLANNRLPNIVRLDSEYADMKLPQKADLIFLGLSFHDFFVKRKDPTITAVPGEFYRQIKASLKPSGLIILVDHSAKPDSGIASTSKLHRIDENWVRVDMQKNGFQFIESLETLRNPKDDFSVKIWKEKVFHKTDRFIHKYRLIDQQVLN